MSLLSESERRRDGIERLYVRPGGPAMPLVVVRVVWYMPGNRRRFVGEIPVAASLLLDTDLGRQHLDATVKLVRKEHAATVGEARYKVQLIIPEEYRS